jgi:hypothetical protein
VTPPRFRRGPRAAPIPAAATHRAGAAATIAPARHPPACAWRGPQLESDMTLEDIKARLPDYAKDLRLNLDSVLS